MERIWLMGKFDYALLGHLIIKQFSLEDENVNLISKWVANYIAQKMKTAEQAVGEEKTEAEEKCFKAILMLWEHREGWGGNGNPYENLQPIINTINRLNPENKDYFYWNNDNEYDAVSSEVQQILDIIKSIDKAARVCLEYLFKYAMEITVDEDMKEWIKAANKLSDEDEEDVSLLRRYMRKSDSDKIDLQEKLEKRILILEEFQGKSMELFELYTEKLRRENGESIN